MNYILKILFLFIGVSGIQGQTAHEYILKGKVAFNSKKDSISAEQYFNQAKILAPNDESIYYRIGEYRIIFWPNHNKSLLEFKKVISLAPDKAMAYYYCGVSLKNLGKYKEALSYFNEYEKKDKKENISHFLYQSKGNCKFMLGDFYGAIKEYNKVIESHKYPSIYYDRAEVKYELKDIRGAISDLSKGIDIYPGIYESAYFFRGNCFFDLEKYNEAIHDYSKVIESNNLDELAYYNRGIAFINLNKIEEGCIDFSKAGELGQNEAYNLIRKYCN